MIRMQTAPARPVYSTVLFLIDISGSMCVSSMVETGDEVGNRAHPVSTEPHSASTPTWVSRLQSVQAAVRAQLNILVKTLPKRSAGAKIIN